MRDKKTILMVLIGILMGFISLSLAVTTDKADYKPILRYGRISEERGRTYYQKQDMENSERARINIPVQTGDDLWTEARGRMEIQFDDRSVLRLWENTSVSILELYSDYDTGAETTRIYVESGDTFLNIPQLKEDATYIIETPSSTVRAIESGIFRIIVDGGLTEIEVHQGLVEVAGIQQTVLVRDNERVEVPRDGDPSDVIGIKWWERDEFYNWSYSRDRIMQTPRSRYLPESVDIGYEELEEYGRWVYIPDYGYVWRPFVRFGWVPYRYGYWIIIEPMGWTWVAYEPWGWVTCHYGSWVWTYRYGWVWVPGPVWAPAWVAWSVYGGYVTWTPLHPWDYWYYYDYYTVYYYYGRYPCYVYYYGYHHPYYPWPYRADTYAHSHANYPKIREAGSSLHQRPVPINHTVEAGYRTSTTIEEKALTRRFVPVEQNMVKANYIDRELNKSELWSPKLSEKEMAKVVKTKPENNILARRNEIISKKLNITQPARVNLNKFSPSDFRMKRSEQILNYRQLKKSVITPQNQMNIQRQQRENLRIGEPNRTMPRQSIDQNRRDQQRINRPEERQNIQPRPQQNTPVPIQPTPQPSINQYRYTIRPTPPAQQYRLGDQNRPRPQENREMNIEGQNREDNTNQQINQQNPPRRDYRMRPRPTPQNPQLIPQKKSDQQPPQIQQKKKVQNNNQSQGNKSSKSNKKN